MKQKKSDVIINSEILDRTCIQTFIRPAQCQQCCTVQGCVMIVFPEYGLVITPSRSTRDNLIVFMEQVPDPRRGRGDWIPCDDPPAADPDPHAVQRELSCIARDHQLYVVAMVGTQEPCNREIDSSCPANGRYHYNTNVVYDPTGLLVARYRKYNLFLHESLVYDRPRTPELVYFDTLFGRVGTFTCFDVIFGRPGMSLVERAGVNISHVAFPTAWLNELPYYAAGPFHQSYAATAEVNLIAANLHVPAVEACGSGVYGWDGVPRAFQCTDDTSSALIVGRIPTQIPHGKAEIGHQSFSPDLESRADFTSSIFKDPFNFVHLHSVSDVTTVCHSGLCCRLNYTRRPQGDNAAADRFALGAFRGLHTYEGQYYLEICLLMTCLDGNETYCGEDATTSTAVFDYVELSGSFSTKYIYPQVVVTGVRPSTDGWEFKRGLGRLVVPRATSTPLLSATLYGRRFDLDDGPPSAGSTQHRASQLLHAISIIIININIIIVVV